MPIAIRSGGSLTGSSTNGGNITINLPAGTAQGDVVYVMATTNGTPAMTTNGYSQVATVSFNAGAETARVFRKVMGATPDTQAVITGTGSPQDSMSAVLYVLTGVDNTTPEDATSPAGATGTSTNPNPPAIVTVTRTAWVLAYAATDGVNTVSSYPSTYSGGISINGNDNNDTTAAVAYREISPAGSADPGTYTINASANWGAMTVAVRPAGFISVPVTGVSGSGAVGSVEVWKGEQVSVTGVSATGNIGTVQVAFPIFVNVTGVISAGAVGNLGATGKAVVELPFGVLGVADLGEEEARGFAQFVVSGVSATGQIGTAGFRFGLAVMVMGVSCTAQEGEVAVWISINDEQFDVWVPVNDAQTPGWVQIPV